MSTTQNGSFTNPELSQYLSPAFSLDNIDRYYVRTSILKAVLKYRSQLSGTLLDIGCGKMPYRNLFLQPEGNITKYIGLDLQQAVTEAYNTADLLWDGKTIPMEAGSVDSVLLTEVLEHCFTPEDVLQEAHRVMKKDGAVLATVPFLWPLHDVPYDEYRYTPFSLEKLFQNSGFSRIEITALGGWNASLGQMMGLWLNRSGIQGWRRKLLYKAFFERFIKWLYKNDRVPDNFTDASNMITGLVVYARK